MRVFLVCLFLPWLGASGEEPVSNITASNQLADDEVTSALALAHRALRDGVPSVAVSQLTGLHEKGELDDEGMLLLAEALVRGGQAVDALELLDEEEEEDAINFWKAAALAGSGRFEEAIDEFEALVASGPQTPLWEESCLSGASLMLSVEREEDARAMLGKLAEGGSAEARRIASLRLAELLLSEGDHSAALQKLGPSSQEWGQAEVPAAIIKARCLIKAGDPSGASAILLPLLDRVKGLTRLEHVLIRLGAADALAGEGKSEQASAVLISLIENRPNALFLDRAFDRLAGLGVLGEVALLDYLQSWSEGNEAGRARLARFSRAVASKQAGQMNEALEAFEEVVQSAGPAQNLSRRALLEMAEIHALTGAVDQARECLGSAETGSVFLPQLQARIGYITGLIEWSEGNYAGAAASFAEMKSNPQDAVVAAINSALAAIRADDEEMMKSAFSSIAQTDTSSEVLAQIRIEQALVAAAEHRPKAQALLASVLNSFPDHPRMPEVELVLAETYLLSIPAFPKAAQKHLEHAVALGLRDDRLRERADYIRVYIAEASFDDAEVIQLATSYLEKWLGSQLAVRIRMKLAEVYDRNHDYPNAQTQFEILAEELGDDPMAESALFFAGRASMSLFNPAGLDRAVETFGRVVELAGTLAPVARLYQAKAKRRSGKDEEALPILDVLIEQETDPAVRKQALIEKLEALLSLGESGEGERFEEAEKVAQFLSSEFSDLGSRFQGAYLTLKIKERIGDLDEAVAAGYEAMAIDDLEMREIANPNVLGWLYRLGFSTAHLLEQLGRNEAAVKVIERLGDTRGDRATEARDYAETIRLRHFIWED